MTEQEFEVPSAAATLSGTLCMPDGIGPFPVVLMVHGSGPLDRDENFRSVKLNIFKTLAGHLCEAGIASLRYDKRGCGKSTGDYHTAGHQDLVDDAIACFDALARSSLCLENRIYVLGHSEGTIIAPQMTFKRPTIAGLILLNPFVQKMDIILLQQARHITEAIRVQTGPKGLVLRIATKLTGDPIVSQAKLLRRLKTTDTPTIRHLFQKIPAKWLREMLAMNPEDIFRSVTTPMLLIGGEKDVQCDPADVDHIAALSRGPVDAYVFKDLTHILRLDRQTPSILNYRKLFKAPVAPEVLTTVTEWLTSRISESPGPLQ